ncbi:MAG: chloride channel protein [Thermoleophilia bacterium]
MKKRLTEETIVLISVLKWVTLATIVGIGVGATATLFLKLLERGTDYTGGFSHYYFVLPAGLFLSALLVKYLAPDAQGHGTEKVIEAVHKNDGRINPRVVPVKLAATLVTIISGGSVGKEGPVGQIGAGVSSLFADLGRFDRHDRKKLVICGISAGFAAVFGTPIAGAIFGIEVLFIGGMLYEVLLPSFIAGIISFQVASALGISYFYRPLEIVPVFSQYLFLEIVGAGIFFGFCSILLIEGLNAGKILSDRIRVWEPFKGLIGGLVLVAGALIFSDRYLGLGLDTIETSLTGVEIVWYAFLLKILFTAVTLNSGGSGGIVTPIFFIGATAGALYADILNLDVATFSAIGLISLLAGAANTPIAAGIMAVEMFGPEVAPWAIMAGIISFLITGHRSVYPSQVLAMKKSSSMDVELGRAIHKIEPRLNPRRRSITGTYLRASRYNRRRRSRKRR